MSLALLAAVGTATVATSFISGILGMAGGMILMGVLLALLPLPQAMLLHGISQAASNGGRAAMLRAHIDWRVVRGYVLGGATSAALFALAHVVLSKAAAMIVLGCMPFATMALPARLRLNVERRGHSYLCGLVCVALSLTAGIAGPILDVFFVRSSLPRHAVVATKAFSQSLSHLAKIGYFGTVLAASRAELPLVLAIAVVLLAFAGTRLSRGVLERMTDASFRSWTRRTILAVGATYLAMGVRTLAA
jgi:uncharacterized membrane protein YfcA